jgi:hypothetical protein
MPIPSKKLYLFTSETGGYDRYDRILVCARREEAAITTVRSKLRHWPQNVEEFEMRQIGVASHFVDEGIIIASFYAG